VPDGVSDKIGLVKVQSRLDQLPDLRCLLRRNPCTYWYWYWQRHSFLRSAYIFTMVNFG